MEYFLGVDVGGTNVKFGLVTSEGEIIEKRKYPTEELREGGQFTTRLLEVFEEELKSHKQVSKVGIGLPGMLSKDRTRAIELANLAELNGFALLAKLKSKFPKYVFHLENDANAAALGELYFGQEQTPDDFLFVTLGTGVGSAAVFDRKLFTGPGGNALELGHIICSKGTTLEDQIGKNGLVRMAMELLDGHAFEHSQLYEKKPLSAKKIMKAALAGDSLAQEVFRRGGLFLGEGLVTAIRLFDVKTIYIGGGVSQTFDYVIEPARQVMEQFLPNYYMKDIDIRMATLGNDAGIIGAASLCFID